MNILVNYFLNARYSNRHNNNSNNNNSNNNNNNNNNSNNNSNNNNSNNNKKQYFMYLEDDWRLLSTSVLHYSLGEGLQQIKDVYENIYKNYNINLYNYNNIDTTTTTNNNNNNNNSSSSSSSSSSNNNNSSSSSSSSSNNNSNNPQQQASLQSKEHPFRDVLLMCMLLLRSGRLQQVLFNDQGRRECAVVDRTCDIHSIGTSGWPRRWSVYTGIATNNNNNDSSNLNNNNNNNNIENNNDNNSISNNNNNSSSSSSNSSSLSMISLPYNLHEFGLLKKFNLQRTYRSHEFGLWPGLR
jgi:hypothetical protein